MNIDDSENLTAAAAAVSIAGLTQTGTPHTGDATIDSNGFARLNRIQSVLEKTCATFILFENKLKT